MGVCKYEKRQKYCSKQIVQLNIYDKVILKPTYFRLGMKGINILFDAAFATQEPMES